MRLVARVTFVACVSIPALLALSPLSHASQEAPPASGQAEAPVTEQQALGVDHQAVAPEDEGADEKAAEGVSTEAICDSLESAAAIHDLPVAFFARLIWQESRFRIDAVSSAGARGIAQFMPQTARWRGLVDPFDPIESLYKSAGYLRELRSQFGNLGLAAAAYNGGSGRVLAWLKGRGGLPRETRKYVEIVTGASPEQWRQGEKSQAVHHSQVPSRLPCQALAAQAQTPGVTSDRSKASQPRWSIVLASGFSKAKADQKAEQLRRRFNSVLGGREPVTVTRPVAGRGKSPMAQVVIYEASRASAESLCAKLRGGGAACTVLRSS